MPDVSFNTAEMVCGRNCGSTEFARDAKLGLDYCTNCGAISGFPYEGQQQVSTPKPAPVARLEPVVPEQDGVEDAWKGSFTRLSDDEFGVKLWMPDQPRFNSDPAEGDLVHVTSRKGRVSKMFLGKHVKKNGRAIIFEKGERA